MHPKVVRSVIEQSDDSPAIVVTTPTPEKDVARAANGLTIVRRQEGDKGRLVVPGYHSGTRQRVSKKKEIPSQKKPYHNGDTKHEPKAHPMTAGSAAPQTLPPVASYPKLACREAISPFSTYPSSIKSFLPVQSTRYSGPPGATVFRNSFTTRGSPGEYVVHPTHVSASQAVPVALPQFASQWYRSPAPNLSHHYSAPSYSKGVSVPHRAQGVHNYWRSPFVAQPHQQTHRMPGAPVPFPGPQASGPGNESDSLVHSQMHPQQNYSFNGVVPPHSTHTHSQMATPFVQGSFVPNSHMGNNVAVSQNTVNKQNGLTLRNQTHRVLFSPREVAALNSRPIVPTLDVIEDVLGGDHSNIARPDSVDAFVDWTAFWGTHRNGVIKISYIPYNTSKAQILKFLGKDPNLIESQAMGVPIHIIMELTTSKTMDCFVEFRTPADAKMHYARTWGIMESFRLRIGNRHVYVDLSNQSELLATLFKRAKCINWVDGHPILVSNTDPTSVGFQGFLSREELWCLAEYTERPHRSPYSTKSNQRNFECTISILYKFPWQVRDLYTVGQRNLLWETYRRQLSVLVQRVNFERNIGIDRRLLEEFVMAGLNCPGFSERMKFHIMIHSRAREMVGRVNQQSEIWPFDILCRSISISDEHAQVWLKCVEAGWVNLSDGLQQRILHEGYVCDMGLVNGDVGPWDVEHNIWFHAAGNEAGNSLTFEDAALYEADLCRFLVKVGVEVLKHQLKQPYINPLEDGSLLAMIERHMDPNKNIAAIEAAKHASVVEDFTLEGYSQGSDYAEPLKGALTNYSYHGRRHSEPAVETPPYESIPTTPVRERPGLTRNTQSETELGGSRFAAVFASTPERKKPTLEQNDESTRVDTPRYPNSRHRRMSSSDLKRFDPTPGSGRRGHNKTNSLPSNDMQASFDDQPDTLVRLGSGLTGKISSVTRMGRGRLSIDATIHEESEEGDQEKDTPLFMRPSASKAVKITNPDTGKELDFESSFNELDIGGTFNGTPSKRFLKKRANTLT